MGYTEDDLIDLIARHDKHEAYYREQLALIRAEEIRAAKEAAWREGFGAGFENLADIADHFRAGGDIATIRPPAANPYTKNGDE